MPKSTFMNKYSGASCASGKACVVLPVPDTEQVTFALSGSGIGKGQDGGRERESVSVCGVVMDQTQEGWN